MFRFLRKKTQDEQHFTQLMELVRLLPERRAVFILSIPNLPRQLVIKLHILSQRFAEAAQILSDCGEDDRAIDLLLSHPEATEVSQLLKISRRKLGRLLPSLSTLTSKDPSRELQAEQIQHILGIMATTRDQHPWHPGHIEACLPIWQPSEGSENSFDPIEYSYQQHETVLFFRLFRNLNVLLNRQHEPAPEKEGFWTLCSSHVNELGRAAKKMCVKIRRHGTHGATRDSTSTAGLGSESRGEISLCDVLGFENKGVYSVVDTRSPWARPEWKKSKAYGSLSLSLYTLYLVSFILPFRS